MLFERACCLLIRKLIMLLCMYGLAASGNTAAVPGLPSSARAQERFYKKQHLPRVLLVGPRLRAALEGNFTKLAFSHGRLSLSSYFLQPQSGAGGSRASTISPSDGLRSKLMIGRWLPDTPTGDMISC